MDLGNLLDVRTIFLLFFPQLNASIRLVHQAKHKWLQ